MANKTVQVVNETASNAGSAAVQNAGLFPELSAFQIVGSIILIVIGTATIVGLGFLLWAKRKKSKYEPTSLEKRIVDKIINPAEKFGTKIHRKFFVGMRKRGIAVKYHKQRTRLNTEKWDLEETEDDTDDNDEQNKVPNDEIENWEGYTFVVRKSGKIGKTMYIAGSVFSGSNSKNMFADYYDVDKKYVIEGDVIKIREEADLVPSGGVYRDDTAEGYQRMHEKAMSSVLEDTLELASNIPEQTQVFNLEHINAVEFLRKKFDVIGDYNKEKEQNKKEKRTD